MSNQSEFEQNMITEFRQLAVKISEAQELIQELTPKHQQLAATLKAYGLDEQVNDVLDDEIDTEPAKKKGEKVATILRDYFIANHNTWTRLSELHDHLLHSGVAIGGRNPKSNLSAHLSNAGIFQVQRARGWRLNLDQYEP